VSAQSAPWPTSEPLALAGSHPSVLTPRELLLADAIAERVAEHLRADDDASRPPRSLRLVDARTVAQALDVNLKSIYRHADKLGGVRVGRRLRFDLNRALRSWPSNEDDRCHSEKSQPPRSPVDKRSSSARQGTPDDTLLPVGRGNRSE
jgi:hypothetical protein